MGPDAELAQVEPVTAAGRSGEGDSGFRHVNPAAHSGRFTTYHSNSCLALWPPFFRARTYSWTSD